MWKRDAGREKADHPMVQELKAVLTPPLPQKTDKARDPVLWTQILLCLVLLGAAAFLRFARPEWLEPCRQQIQSLMEQGERTDAPEKLVRFASSITQEAKMQVNAWMEMLDDQSKAQQGMGGLFPQKKKQLPPGYSLECYEPKEPLQMPLEQFSVTSDYGWRDHPINGKLDFHTGMDLAQAEGEAITAALEGIVLDSGRNASYGNYVLLLHKDGVETRYCHMQYVFVRKGESVAKGEQLGTVGHTGMATGPHLHFELIQNNIHYDPAKALGL